MLGSEPGEINGGIITIIAWLGLVLDIDFADERGAPINEKFVTVWDRVHFELVQSSAKHELTDDTQNDCWARATTNKPFQVVLVLGVEPHLYF